MRGDARPRPETLTWEDFDSQLRGAVKGTLATTQAALPGMREAGSGRIVTIGTTLSQHPVVPYHDYTAAKAAALSLTRTLATDLGPDGITVNMVSGGLLRTTDASAATPEEVFDVIASGTPLRRAITPAELADAVLFFASPWARAVTGQNLIVDGGLVKGCRRGGRPCPGELGWGKLVAWNCPRSPPRERPRAGGSRRPRRRWPNSTSD